MESIHINMVAVLIAVVANFVLGFIWYTPLFGKLWAKENGFDITRKPLPSELAKGMIFMIIGNFLMAYVFAHNMAAWNHVPGVTDMSAAQNACMAAVFTWLGFFVPQDLGTVAWERKSWTLFFINTAYHLASLFLVAMILAYMV